MLVFSVCAGQTAEAETKTAAGPRQQGPSPAGGEMSGHFFIFTAVLARWADVEAQY